MKRLRSAACLYISVFALVLSMECTPQPRMFPDFPLMGSVLFMVSGFAFAVVLFDVLGD